MTSPDLHIREVEIAKKILVTGIDAKEILKIFGLLQNVSDLTIVDLAAGASLVTSMLLERGANAFAFDRIYRDRLELMDTLNHRSLPELKRGARVLEPLIADAIIKKASREIGQFFRSFDRHRERYIDGWLTQLPFTDNFADWVVSSSGVSILYVDFEVMSKSFQEAIRILKPGGTLLISPFMETPESEEPHQALFEELTTLNIGRVTVERGVNLPSDNRLRFVKAA